MCECVYVNVCMCEIKSNICMYREGDRGERERERERERESESQRERERDNQPLKNE